jgi:hypothetical protein
VCSREHEKKLILAKREKESTKMKKYETIKKEAQTITIAELKEIAKNNDKLNYEFIAEDEFSKICLIFYRELKKAVDTKDAKLELNCNYAKRSSKASDDVISIYDFAINSNNIQIYIKKRVCAIATTKKCAFAEALANSELNFKAESKKTHKESIAFDDLCNILKQVIAIVKLTDMQQLEAKKSEAEQSEAE